MAAENLLSVNFTEEEVQQANMHLTALQALFSPKCISLTPAERKEYGRIGDKTENWARKGIDYMKKQPQFNPKFIDVEEAKNDFAAREILKPLLNKIIYLKDLMDDSMLALGADINHVNLGYYQNIKLLAKQNVNGAKAIYEDLKARFPYISRRK